MDVPFWQIVSVGIAMFVASILTACVVMAAVALGAWIVYKTKREDGSGLFRSEERTGDVFVAPGEIDDGLDIPLGEDTTNRKMNDPIQTVMQHAERFLKQGAGLGGKQ